MRYPTRLAPLVDGNLVQLGVELAQILPGRPRWLAAGDFAQRYCYVFDRLLFLVRVAARWARESRSRTCRYLGIRALPTGKMLALWRSPRVAGGTREHNAALGACDIFLPRPPLTNRLIAYGSRKRIYMEQPGEDWVTIMNVLGDDPQFSDTEAMEAAAIPCR